MHVQLKLGRHGSGNVLLNGTDVASAVSGLTLRAIAGEPTELVLAVQVDEVEVDGDLHVQVPPAVRGLLIASGWTPPADQPVIRENPRRANAAAEREGQ
jgi:hypothetical protein